MIDKQVKKIFGSWASFAETQGENKYNFKRKILQNIQRLNRWLNPVGIEIKMVLKKPKRVGKNIKTDTGTTDD